MAWGGAARSGAAVMTAAVLLAVVPGCAAELDQAHSAQTRLGRVAAVADVHVEVSGPGQGARVEIVLQPGLTADEVVALAADVSRVAEEVAYPSYRLDLMEPGTGDGLTLDDTFATDPRATAVVAAWRRAAGVLVGDTVLSYQHGRTVVRVVSDGGLAHDVAETSRLALPPQPVTWRFETGPGTVLLDGRVTADDVDLVERVQRTVVSPSLALPAETWRLERRRTHAELDLATDLGPVPAAQVTPDAWGQRLAPLARAAAAALGRPRRQVVIRLTRPTDTGTDVLAWWTSDRPPSPGRDRLARGWDAWLVAQVAAV